MADCIACNSLLSHHQLHDFAQCPSCGSYIYCSNNSAEEDNKAYFNQAFATLKNKQESRLKRAIFENLKRQNNERQKKELSAYYQQRGKIMGALSSGKRVLEIGFGKGDNLSSLLDQGIDAFGIDISETAVTNFQNRFPHYSDRVKCAIRFDKPFEIVYCSALFEHLDKPTQFIQDASSSLSKDGLLIIDALPVLNSAKASITKEEDINFWAPCHRIIYSMNGLLSIFRSSGFVLDEYASYDEYNYRVLSLHRRKGYKAIIELRNPCLKNKDLPRAFHFYLLCRATMDESSLALFGIFSFRKTLSLS